MSVHPDATLASRYLANQLTAAERADYEDLLSRDVAALEELEATARLKVGLGKLGDKQEIPTLLRPEARSRYRYLLPLAAGVAAVAIGTALWHSNSGHMGRPIFSPSAPRLPVLATTEIFRKRSQNADIVIDLPDTRGILEWHWILPSPTAPRHYTVVLTKTGEGTREVVGTMDSVEADPSGIVRWYVDTAELAPGRYELKLTGKATEGQTVPPETFLISVRKRSKT